MSEEKKPKGHSSELTEAAKKLGSAGGKIGGPKRAQVLTAAERSKIASEGGKAKAAKAKSVKAKLKSKKGKPK